MRRTVTALLLSILALAGCSDSGGESTADAKQSPSPSATADPADAFMEAVTNTHLDSWSNKMPLVPARDELTVFPPQWCEALEAGHTVQWMLGEGDLYPIGQTWGTEKTDAYHLILLGTQAYCPKWTDQVREDLRASGKY
ncbi:hypothetical protein [Streptomyces sp. NPDC052127]|uniref:hypothetical protein n=1 Tax=Streptomyces sp. NPDC052127 TaxID=3155679 RepID=UPI0034318856